VCIITKLYSIVFFNNLILLLSFAQFRATQAWSFLFMCSVIFIVLANYFVALLILFIINLFAFHAVNETK